MKSLFSERAEHEALLAYDFKLADFKTALMKLCFSPLANWPLFVIILILYFNPFRYQFQILNGFSGAISFIYAPHWQLGLSFGIICSYFLGLINIPIAIALYFISQGEVHTIIAGSMIIGVFAGRSLKYFKLAVKLESETRKMAIYFNIVQLTSLVAATFISLYIYEYMTVMGLFSRTLFAYRFEFISIGLFVIYAAQLILNGIWGHFYARKSFEPSKIQIYYSTAQILRRLSFGSKMKAELKQQVAIKEAELKIQLADSSVAYLPKTILNTAKQEQTFLDLAQKYLG
ncbi:MAG: hypothetical protein H7235_05185 [Bdellovibrionaceae bacterium]|nr:hypothetical protein [Pseudobdellovibrionaceae bacterium]